MFFCKSKEKKTLEPASSTAVEKLLLENEALYGEISQLKTLLEQAREKISWFEEQVKLARQQRFGKSSEALSSIQTEIIFNVLEDLHLLKKDVTSSKQKIKSDEPRKKVDRKIDTSLFPRRQEMHDLIEAEKTCCGKPMHKVRDDISEQFETIKQVYVVEHIHPQYACRTCETIKSAKKPASVVPKSMAGASLISDVIIGKYEHHLPLYRQSKIFKSTGVDVDDNTLGNWVMQAGEGLRVMDDALYEEISLSRYAQVDETPVKVLKPEKKAYMWTYLAPLQDTQLIRFRFDLTRSSQVVEADLKNFTGLLQTDAYNGYNEMRKKSDVTAFGCMAHSRRKFAEIVKISQKPGKAHEALEYFAALYAIEQNAREQKLNFDERKVLREKEASLVLKTFHSWLEDSKRKVPPQSKIGNAIEYALKQWPFLIRYINYGEVEIDNNWVENQIRPFALGRGNWLFVAHEESAQIAALYYSLIQSAKMNHLNPRIYMHYLLTKVHDLRRKEIFARDLLPNRIDKNLLNQFAEEEFKKAQKLFLPQLPI